VRTKKQLSRITAGTTNDRERDAAIMNFLESHPGLLQPNPPPESLDLARALCGELAKSDDTNAVRLVLKSGNISPTFPKKHHEEMRDYARSITGEKAVANAALTDRLYESGDSSVVALFEKWAPYAKTRGESSYFESVLRELRKPESQRNPNP